MFTTAKDRIRKFPHVIFDSSDIYGVENAFKSMLYIFSEEAIRGGGKEIAVRLYLNSAISINLVTERGGIQLGDVDSDGSEWKKRLVDFEEGAKVKCYNDFLFADISEKDAPKKQLISFDNIYKLPMLVCNQYVTEFMSVCTKTHPYEKVKNIRFNHGEAESYLTEIDSDIEGTYVYFRYDPEVFTDINLSRGFIENALDEAALNNIGVKYVLKDETESDVEFEIKTFHYETIDAYMKNLIIEQSFKSPVFSATRIDEGRDDHFSRPYDVVINMAATFTDGEPKVCCYFNEHKLDNGGAFLYEFYRCIQKHINYISSRYALFNMPMTLTIRELKRHISVVFSIRTINCLPDWGDSRRTSVNNEMITELVENIVNNEVRNKLFSDIDAVLKLTEIIKEERLREKAENNYLQTFENAIEDYSNGDGKSNFVNCLFNTPRTDEGYISLTIPMFKDVCKKEPLYYYILMTDFAKFISREEYEVLRKLYRENIGGDVPSFFVIDEKFEKITRW